jgi:Transposase DDE domain group 1
MENQIEGKLMFFGDHTSTDILRSSQIGIYFSSMANLLMKTLRRLGRKQTGLVRPQARTIRLTTLKIAASIRITVRNVYVSLAGGHSYTELFVQTWGQLQASSAPC